MEPLTDEARIVEEHLGFIDRLGPRLRDDAYGLGGPPLGAITDQLPGLRPLLHSLVAASPTPRKVKERLVEEWNPFAQRILLADEKPPDASAFEREFSLITTYAQTFVEWGHEAIHILAIEPWLCGRRELRAEEDLVSWHLASEGLAFWYADIVITRKIREMVPEAELVYTRQAVSNTSFHPEQAFRRLGLTDPVAILPLYIAAFLGKDTGLESQGHPFSTVLAKRLRDFYTGTRSTLQGLHSVLEMFSLLDGYYRRFCAAPGLPSLLDDEALGSAGPVEDFHVRLGSQLLPRLQELPPERIRRVCARRHVQTRAYYAWFVRQAIEKRWVFGNAQLQLEPAAAALDAYLDGLEQTLKPLAAATPGDPAAVIDRLKALDQAYETDVRGPLAHGQAHVKYRYHLYPYFAPTGGIVGLADSRSGYSPQEMLEVTRFVMSRCTWDAELIGRLSRFLGLADTGSEVEVRAAFNDFMTHPLAMEGWSLPLDGVDPVRNQFRELIFEYT